MASLTLVRLLDRLDQLKRSFRAADQLRIEKTLVDLNKRRFADAGALIRFHEALLFLRAYPQSPRILNQVESILNAFLPRIKLLRRAEADFEPFTDPEVSGIIGTSLTAIFSYPIARWLAERHPADATLDLDGFADDARLGPTLPRFIPLLEEESLVEANVPYAEWLRAAQSKRGRVLPWLIQRFEGLPYSEKRKAELYDALKLYIHLRVRRYRGSRTGMKFKTREVFYHDKPPLTRKDISLVDEMNGPPLPLEKFSERDGARLLDLIRDTSAIRYRELHGFTFGDPANVIRAVAGRGVELFINGVDPAHRLPLRAYHSVFMVKNGVPVGYVEGLSLFERMEVGFNVYYTFREGESAWIYARVLRLFRQLLGVTVFSIDPYQIGFDNEEGIESGAFWFYRKLGFRPVDVSIARMVALEEKKLATRTGYRTPRTKLRELSKGHMLFELEPDKTLHWDRFQIRKLGLAVAREMGEHFGGDGSRMRRASLRSASRVLGVDSSGWSAGEQSAFENMSVMLSLIPGISRWTMNEKRALVKIILTKTDAEESKYLRLMQNHHRFRDGVIELGS